MAIDIASLALKNKILHKVETRGSSVALYFDKLALPIFGYFPNIKFISKTKISYGEVLSHNISTCDEYSPKDNFICVCFKQDTIKFYFYAPSIEAVKFKWF